MVQPRRQSATLIAALTTRGGDQSPMGRERAACQYFRIIDATRDSLLLFFFFFAATKLFRFSNYTHDGRTDE